MTGRAGRAPDAARALPELLELEALAAAAGGRLRRRIACSVDAGGCRFEVPVLALGSLRSDAPAVGYFGGVHGLERIGSGVVIAWLRSLVTRLRWDALLLRLLEDVLLLFMPVVNPGGMWLGTRANPHGIDLMRNAPVEAQVAVPWGLGGQRMSAALPWYRGPAGAPMAAEAAALCHVVEDELLSRPFSIAVDCHSGFGARDRLWFPYAHSAEPIARLAEMHALTAAFEASHAQHRYIVEPQSRHYLAHGDLWDHLVLRQAAGGGTRVFLPLTLEMGSWLWVRKNPRQLFSRQGLFNPLIAHREQRVLRQHVAWLEFVARAAYGHARWLPAGQERERHHALALRRWYGGVNAA